MHAVVHQEVILRKEKRRVAAANRSPHKDCGFSEGDYPSAGSQAAGALGWAFPRVCTLSHSFMITHLVTGDEYEVHGSRLKHYCDAELGATAEILEHVTTQGIVLGVRAIVDHRYDTSAKEWQLLVAWRGLEDSENS
ncbi:hypothetical protein PHMEG_00030368 [Phytophthora megakarya]|uniref:Chromo domain-containing protein n=1 Tax=Phytophthora megakarya TaxID=4795 RepID=A0A225V028_9STRA|nr:hypothetical protein PHMEG_00030368 [Phytophthora megakarya]